MLKVDLEDFTDYDVAPFYADRPVPYIESKRATSKLSQTSHDNYTSSSHELVPGQEIIVIGCKVDIYLH